MKSYSHNGEDVLLDRIFADDDFGFYLDVGACIPEKSSNTYALYQRGWRGLVIDPMLSHPRLAAEWKALRPQDCCVAAAAGATNGELDFWVCNAVQFSTGAPAIIDYWTAGAVKAQVGGPSCRMPMRTLNAILAEYGPECPAQLLNLDVEGMEGAVLAGLDLVRHRPWIMLIESALPGKGVTEDQPWQTWLFDHGYGLFHDDGVNRWYVATEYREIVSGKV